MLLQSGQVILESDELVSLLSVGQKVLRSSQPINNNEAHIIIISLILTIEPLFFNIYTIIAKKICYFPIWQKIQLPFQSQRWKHLFRS